MNICEQLNSVGSIECGEDWPDLVRAVCDRLHPTSVLDLGCGPCRSLANFKSCGVPRVVGVDGSVALLDNPHVNAHKRDVVLMDLEKSPCKFGEPFDLVWSYEVAEHIANEDNFVATVAANAAKWIVMTAAPPGQGGIGHVNCQTREHWIARFEAEGFSYREDLMNVFKALGRARTGYYDQNGMVFSRGQEDAPMLAAPDPINIKIAGHFACYKDKRATYEALKSFRQHFPDAPVHLCSDAGDNFQDIADHFECDYTHFDKPVGNGRTTEFDTHEKAKEWFHRLDDTCERYPEADWIVILEDDVRTQGPIRHFPPASMAGPCTMPFSSVAQYAIKLRHPNLTIHGYSGCGGTIIHRETFQRCMRNFYDIGQVALLDGRLAIHSDAMLTYSFLWNGFENAPWLDHSERSRGIGRPDAAFDHQFKAFYGHPWTGLPAELEG